MWSPFFPIESSFFVLLPSTPSILRYFPRVQWPFRSPDENRRLFLFRLIRTSELFFVFSPQAAYLLADALTGRVRLRISELHCFLQVLFEVSLTKSTGGFRYQKVVSLSLVLQSAILSSQWPYICGPYESNLIILIHPVQFEVTPPDNPGAVITEKLTALFAPWISQNFCGLLTIQLCKVKMYASITGVKFYLSNRQGPTKTLYMVVFWIKHSSSGFVVGLELVGEPFYGTSIKSWITSEFLRSNPLNSHTLLLHTLGISINKIAPFGSVSHYSQYTYLQTYSIYFLRSALKWSNLPLYEIRIYDIHSRWLE